MEVPINYLAVIVAAIVSMAIGFFWYGNLFGKAWMRLAGITQDDMKSMKAKMSPLAASIGGFLTALLMSYVLAHALVFGNAYLGMFGAGAGMMGAFWYWLGFVVPVTAGVYLWEGKSWKLWAINAGYYFVSLLVMGAILASWV